jgi:hypothetical protein
MAGIAAVATVMPAIILRRVIIVATPWCKLTHYMRDTGSFR